MDALTLGRTLTTKSTHEGRQAQAGRQAKAKTRWRWRRRRRRRFQRGAKDRVVVVERVAHVWREARIQKIHMPVEVSQSHQTELKTNVDGGADCDCERRRRSNWDFALKERQSKIGCCWGEKATHTDRRTRRELQHVRMRSRSTALSASTAAATATLVRASRITVSIKASSQNGENNKC